MLLEEDISLIGKKVLLKTFVEQNISTKYINWLNDPEIMKFSNQRFITHTRSSCLNYLKSFLNTNNIFLDVSLANNGNSIGTMTAYISQHHGVVDIGIMIGDKSIWGQGYGQDAWDTLLEWFITKKTYRKITAGTLACNYGMINLMERSDMALEATRKKHEIINCKPVDVLYYAKFI